MLHGLDMKQGTAGRGAGDRLTCFIATKPINNYMPSHLRDVIITPVTFRTSVGALAYGYEATVLANIRDAVLDARKKWQLNTWLTSCALISPNPALLPTCCVLTAICGAVFVFYGYI